MFVLNVITSPNNCIAKIVDYNICKWHHASLLSPIYNSNPLLVNDDQRIFLWTDVMHTMYFS